MLHGDIKPGNIVVEDLGQARVSLVDFGLSDGGAGGTLQYAPPDRLAGARLTPASDIYSLGLVLFEMIHGHAPWPEVSLSEQLTRRRRESPEPSTGPAWLQEILAEMLSLDAGQRPTSAIVADTFEANGAVLPYPGPELVRQRAATVHVPRPDADDAVERWLGRGGALAIAGERGSGRSHVLTRAVQELQARGLPCLRIVGVDRPWGAIQGALQSPVLVGEQRGGELEPELAHRAQAAAARLSDAAPPYLGVVVDDWDSLDEGSQRTVEAMVLRGTLAVLISAVEAPTWVPETVTLARMTPPELEQLARDLLGESGDLEALVKALHDASGGIPATAVDLMVLAVSSGAVVRRSHRWLVDEARLTALVASSDSGQAIPMALTAEARRVGELCALHGEALSIARLRSLSGCDAATLRLHLATLRAEGVVRVEQGLVQVRDPRMARRLLAESDALAARHGSLASFLLTGASVPWARLAVHLVGAADPALVHAHGTRCLAAAVLDNPRSAGALADALWELAPGPELAAGRIRALADAGRTADAMAFGDELIARGQATWQACVALCRAAHYAEASAKRQDDYLGQARRLLGDDPAPLALLALESRSLRDRGQPLRAIQVARNITERPPPSTPEDLELWLLGHMTLAQCLEGLGRAPEALLAIESVPDGVGEGTRGRSALDADHGRLLWKQGRVREAGEALARAAAHATGLPLMDRARTLNNAAIATYMSGERAAGLSLWEDCLLMFERLGSTLEQVRVHVNLCHGYREVGRWERSRQSGVLAFETAQTLGEHSLRAHAASNLAALRLWREEPVLAATWLDTADGIIDEHGLDDLRPELARLRAELAVMTESPHATALADRAAALAVTAEQPIEAARAQILAVVGRVRSGVSVDIDGAIAAAEEPLRDMGAAGDLAELRLWFAEIYLLAGRRRDALAQVARVVVYADEVGHAALRGRADALTTRAGTGLSDGLDDRSELLLDLAVAVTRERDLPTLLDAIIDGALSLLEGTRSFVVLVEDGKLRVAAARRRDGGDPGSPSMSIVRRAIEGGKEVIAADLGERGDLRDARSVLDLQLGSVMCVPLIDGAVSVGAIVVDSPNASEQELMQAARLLRALAAHAAVAVNNARHLRETLQRARWAAEVAHDIRGPVGSMMTLASELKSGRRDLEEHEQAMSDIVSLGNQVLELAGSLLGKRTLTLVHLDLAHLCRAVARSLEHDASNRGVFLAVHAESPGWVQGDPAQLGRVLANLMGNALKYSPPGSQVDVTVLQRSDEVEVTLRDHGPGIPDGEQEAIFSSGVQGQGSLPGHGLGLAICRSLVHEHGGTIDASNHPEGGALFRVRFHRAQHAVQEEPVGLTT